MAPATGALGRTLNGRIPAQPCARCASIRCVSQIRRVFAGATNSPSLPTAGAGACALLALLLVCLAPAAAQAAGTIPAPVRAELLGEAQLQASREGDSHPYDIRALRTTLKLAERATGGVTTLERGPGPAVYLIAMRGRFVCDECSPPHGIRAPRGSIMTLVLPVNKGEAVGGEFGFRSHYPSLASAGTPVTLSGESARSTTTQRLLKDECDEPLLPGRPVPPCAPPPPAGALGTRLALDRAHAGRVYLRASTAIADTAGAGTDASVQCAVYLDGGAVSSETVSVPGGEHRQVTIGVAVSVPGGRHTVVLEAAGAEFTSREPGELLVSESSIIALSTGGGA